jgi:hypothetical protein
MGDPAGGSSRRADLRHPGVRSSSRGRGSRDRRRDQRGAPQPARHPRTGLVREDRGLGDHDRLRRLGGTRGADRPDQRRIRVDACAMARPHALGCEDRRDGRDRIGDRGDLSGAFRRRDPGCGGPVSRRRRGGRSDPVADRLDRRVRRVRRRRGVHPDLRQARRLPLRAPGGARLLRVDRGDRRFARAPLREVLLWRRAMASRT